jgi:murein DD-endopeptidase MepM/ murein hydrolase activator NlpD
MDKFFTLVLVPEKNQKIRSFKIPSFVLKVASILTFALLLFVVIILFDYWKLMQNVVDNKHITMENRQLREQLQLFQMKINTLKSDVERISLFEQKLKTITGLDRDKLTKSYFETLQVIQEQNQNELDKSDEVTPSRTRPETQAPNDLMEKIQDKNMPQKPELKIIPEENKPSAPAPAEKTTLKTLQKIWNHLFPSAYAQELSPLPETTKIKEDVNYLELKDKYQQLFLKAYGLSDHYDLTPMLSMLIQRSQELASEMALFDYRYDFLKNEIAVLEIKLNDLDQFLLDRASMLESTPIFMPTNGWITSYFGPRINPYTSRLKMHEGIDIGAPNGAQIRSPADGVVIFAGVKPGFGKHVQIDHGYGIETVYAHSERLFVKTGQKIKRSDLLANVGSTGHSTGPHLHYEVRINGVPVDPFYFILE